MNKLLHLKAIPLHFSIVLLLHFFYTLIALKFLLDDHLLTSRQVNTQIPFTIPITILLHLWVCYIADWWRVFTSEKTQQKRKSSPLNLLRSSSGEQPSPWRYFTRRENFYLEDTLPEEECRKFKGITLLFLVNYTIRLQSSLALWYLLNFRPDKTLPTFTILKLAQIFRVTFLQSFKSHKNYARTTETTLYDAALKVRFQFPVGFVSTANKFPTSIKMPSIP